jgi:hypothetical protein
MLMKYILYLIYTTVWLVIFLCKGIGLRAEDRGVASVLALLPFSTGRGSYRSRKLLAKDLIEKGPVLLNPFPPKGLDKRPGAFIY